MTKPFEQPEGSITLDDNDMLKSLGIRGLPSGMERMLRHHKEVLEVMDEIEKRADGLQSLDLDQKTLTRLSQDRDQPADVLGEELRLFRDLKKKGD